MSVFLRVCDAVFVCVRYLKKHSMILFIFTPDDHNVGVVKGCGHRCLGSALQEHCCMCSHSTAQESSITAWIYVHVW